MKKNGNKSIEVHNVSKLFRIPHERHVTLKAAALNIFNKVSFTEFLALDDVSFDVRQGEFFGIIGRNGSGKSTLLKIIAGIYTPTNGQIDINGRISPFLELGVGFNPELTARENIFLGGAILGLSRKMLDDKFDDIIEFSELEEFVDMKFKNFSSGMQVRLAFSLAIHAHAEILLMDEVLAVGDANFQEKCIREFGKFKREGRTIVFVTHGMDTVEKFCDRVLLLDKGKMVALGDAKKVATEYAKLNAVERDKEGDEGQSLVNENDRKIELRSVESFNSQGGRSKTFQTGEDIRLEIKYFARERIEKPVVGVAFFTSAGIYVSGPNSKSAGVIIQQADGESVAELMIRRNPFLEGGYYASVVFFDWDMTVPLEHSDRALNFHIVGTEEKYGGIVKLDASWKC